MRVPEAGVVRGQFHQFSGALRQLTIGHGAMRDRSPIAVNGVVDRSVEAVCFSSSDITGHPVTELGARRGEKYDASCDPMAGLKFVPPRVAYRQAPC